MFWLSLKIEFFLSFGAEDGVSGMLITVLPLHCESSGMGPPLPPPVDFLATP